MATRVCVAVEVATPMAGSAAGRAVNEEPPVAERGEVASVATGVAAHACGRVGVGTPPSRPFVLSLFYTGVYRQSLREAWAGGGIEIPPRRPLGRSVETLLG